MKKFTIIFIIVVVVLVLAGGAVWYVQRSASEPVVKKGEEQNEEENGKVAGEGVDTSDTSADEAGWKTYRNEEYGFELRYPREWLIRVEKNNVYFARDISAEQVAKEELGLPLVIKVSSTEFNSSEQWLADQFSNKSQEMAPEFSLFQTATVKGIKYTDPLSMGGCDENFVIVNEQQLYQLYRHGSTCDYSNDLFMEVIESLKFD